MRGALALGAAVPLLVALGSGCIERGYPLGKGAGVDIRPDTVGSLFAADLIDADGKALLPRQTPFLTGVTIALTEGTEAANGAYVDVRVEPPEALALTPDESEDSSERTCKLKDGKFRCTATFEGIARFIATSEGNWSGTANLVVSWADEHKDFAIHVAPAGLPASADNFSLVASGLTNSNHVLPTYSALSCTTIDSLPSDLGSKWRPGKIRSREAFVRATAQSDDPGAVENAPVLIESLAAEAALSLDPACDSDQRKTRLRVLLDKTGESPPFYFCFSDIGGTAEFAVTSGEISLPVNPTIIVDPEPRVLRVAALTSTVEQALSLATTTELFEVTAFNTDLEQIAMPVDLESSDPEVMKLLKASSTLSAEGIDPTTISILAVAPGKAVLHVRPRLFSKPDCASIEITVTAAEPEAN